MHHKLLLIAVMFVHLSYAQTNTVLTEEIKLQNDSIQLPGTLSYSETKDKQPLVIYVHGSGNVDRNGNQGGMISANYIKQLADALNTNGIAFYRYDKRTSNMANMKFLMQGISFQDFVEDVKVAINQFKDDNRFSSITLIGHSQGSLVAMLALTEDVDRYVSLAGPGEPFDSTMVKQIRKQNGDSIANIVASHFEELKEKGAIENIDPNLMAIFNPQNLSFLKSWINYDPAEVIKGIDIPILIVNGKKDIQVLVKDAEALHNANPAAELKLIDDMNHVLKNITNEEDNLKSYSTPDYPISDELVSAITGFVKK
jgi:pimeloyl-ACP methyl ester carboxylesterase